MVLRQKGTRKKWQARYVTWTSWEFEKEGEKEQILFYGLHDYAQRAYRPSIFLYDGEKMAKEILPAEAGDYELLETNEIGLSNLKLDGFYFYDKKRLKIQDFISFLKESGVMSHFSLELLDGQGDELSQWYKKEGIPFSQFFLPFARDKKKRVYAAWFRLGKEMQLEEDLIISFGDKKKIQYAALNYRDFFTQFLFHNKDVHWESKNSGLKKFQKTLKSKWGIEENNPFQGQEKILSSLEFIYQDWIKEFLSKDHPVIKKPMHAMEHQPEIPARRQKN